MCAIYRTIIQPDSHPLIEDFMEQEQVVTVTELSKIQLGPNDKLLVRISEEKRDTAPKTYEVLTSIFGSGNFVIAIGEDPKFTKIEMATRSEPETFPDFGPYHAKKTFSIYEEEQ